MAEQTVADVQSGFTGLNTTADAAHLQPGEFTQGTNAKLAIQGGVTPRLGSQRMHSTALAGPIQAVFVWQATVLSPPPILLVIAGGFLYRAAMTIPPWTFTQVGACSRHAAPSIVEFTDAAGADCVYISDISSYWRYDGTTLTQITTAAPFPSVMAVMNQRLFAIEGSPGSTFNQNLFWSSLNSGDDCGLPSIPGAGGNAVVLTFGESYPTSLCPFQNMLAIGQFGGISSFTGWGNSDISIQTGTAAMSAETGVWNNHGMCSIESFAVLSSDRGAYVVTPYGFLQQISKPIENIWKQMNNSPILGSPPSFQVQGPTVVGQPPFAQFFGGSSVVGGWALHDKIAHSAYFLGNAAPGATAIPIFVYNYRVQGWTGPWLFNWNNGGTVPTITCIGAGNDEVNGNWYVLAGCSDGFVRRIEAPGLGLDDVNYDGTGGLPYTMSVTTRPLPGTGQSGPMWWDEKAWLWTFVQAQLQNPLSMSITTTTWPTEGLPQAQQQVIPGYVTNQPDSSPRPYRIKCGGRGNYITVTINDTPINNPLGQNVYSAVRVVGQSYGERYAP